MSGFHLRKYLIWTAEPDKFGPVQRAYVWRHVAELWDTKLPDAYRWRWRVAATHPDKSGTPLAWIHSGSEKYENTAKTAAARALAKELRRYST